MSTTDIKPGIYYNMPEEKYFAIPAIHNSLLTTMKNQSPKHARYYEEHGSEASKVQKIGSKLHMALLEPSRYRQDSIPYLSGHGNTKRVRNSKKLVKKLYPDASYYSKLEKWKQYNEQAEVARSGEIGEKVFSLGESEVTFVAKDPETGLLLKCRWDFINFKLRVGLDYKTTRNAHPDKFLWSIYNYGYYRQVALYRYIASLLDVDLRTQLILAQEKKAPYVAVWYDLHQTALVKGKNEVRELINEYAEYKRNGNFPGYINPKTGRNIIQIDLPDKAYMDDYE